MTTGVASVAESAWTFVSVTRLMADAPRTLSASTWLLETSKLAVTSPAAPVAMPSALMLRSGASAVPLDLIEKLPWPLPVTEAVMPVPLSLLSGSPATVFEEMSMMAAPAPGVLALGTP